MDHQEPRAKTDSQTFRHSLPFTVLRGISLGLLEFLDQIIYTFVGIAFVSAAALTLIFSAQQLAFDFGVNFSIMGIMPAGPRATNPVLTVLNLVSDLLLVLIIMEVLGTIRSYIRGGDSKVAPFLSIGIISATRSILSIGARLSIQQLSADEFRNSMIELAIDALIIVALGVTMRVLPRANGRHRTSPPNHVTPSDPAAPEDAHHAATAPEQPGQA